MLIDGSLSPVCSPRLDGKPDGPIEAWRRANPRLRSGVVGFSDVDQVVHRYGEGIVRQVGLLETKVRGQKIDNTDPRIQSQADTLGRLSLAAMVDRLGNLDERLPGVAKVWDGFAWILFHGWAGVELSGSTIEDSSTITWARPAPAIKATGRFHLPAVQRWTITAEHLTDLLLFQRGWDDPTLVVGTGGIRREDGYQKPWSGLRLDETGQVWIVGTQKTWRD